MIFLNFYTSSYSYFILQIHLSLDIKAINFPLLNKLAVKLEEQSRVNKMTANESIRVREMMPNESSRVKILKNVNDVLDWREEDYLKYYHESINIFDYKRISVPSIESSLLEEGMKEKNCQWDPEFVRMIINNSKRANMPKEFSQGKFEKRNLEKTHFIRLEIDYENYADDGCCTCCIKSCVFSPIILLSCCCIVKPCKVWHCHGLRCHQANLNRYLYFCWTDEGNPFLIWIKHPKPELDCVNDCLDCSSNTFNTNVSYFG